MDIENKPQAQQMQATVSTATKSLTHIDTQNLFSRDTVSRWHYRHLPATQGKTEFKIGKVCQDICLTASTCLFSNDYHACIDYTDAITLLIFGIKGYSHFGFSGTGHTHTVRPGDVWLIQTNSTALFRTTPAGQENQMVVLKYTSERLHHAFNDDPHSSRLLNGTQLIRLGHQVSAHFGIDTLMANPLSNASDCLLAESQALALLARWVAPTVTTPLQPCQTEALSTQQRQQLKGIIDTLTSDLTCPPSLHALTEQVNMSHTKLNRCFKKAYGTTVYSWLRNFRLERARSHLQQSRCNITAIAFQCGFSSASHFSQAFKQQYGCSPLEYRAQHPRCSLNDTSVLFK